ncbi:MAG: CHAT domain-containing protein [Cyanobacteria bacterium P01_D01_bin.73]
MFFPCRPAIFSASAVATGAIAITFGQASTAIAQSITPAPNDPFTQVEQQGNQFTITGGDISADNASRFHSFGEFNLNAGETATFITPAETQAVVGRVVNGNPSLIDGTLQLQGSQADLYLLNPAGIVFGKNAALDVPGSFTGTSASGVGFQDGVGNVRWFDVFGQTGGADLLGTPSLLRFEIEPPGSIATFGNLTVGRSERITLAGGNILQTGTLTAPAGTIALVSLATNRILRFEPLEQFSIVSSDSDLGGNTGIFPVATTNPMGATINPLDLPTLLTGAEGLYPATAVSVTEDQQIVLRGTNLRGDFTGNTALDFVPGSTIVNGLLDISSSDIQSFRAGISVITGRRVSFISGTIDGRGIRSAGLIRVGNDIRDRPSQIITEQVTIDGASLIDSSALLQGNAGIVTVIAAGETQLLGQVRAQGGALAGNGGIFITSGDLTTGDLDVSAVNGQAGAIVDSDSPLAASLSNGFAGFLSTFGMISAFEEFNSILDALVEQVDVKDPTALASAIAALDMEMFSPEFAQASEIAIETLGEFEQILDATFNPEADFKVRNNIEVQNLAGLLPNNAAGTLLATVDASSAQLRQRLGDRLDELTASELVGNIEHLRAAEYGDHWGVTYQAPAVESSVDSIQTILKGIAQNPGKKAAVVYAFIHDDDLELTLVLPTGAPKRHRFRGVVPYLLAANQELRWHITNPLQENPETYQKPAQTLYRWLLAPFRETLDQQGAELLLFSLDSGLRSLPLAALHDGQQYLVENYATAIIPSFGLLETQYQPLTDATVLVAGASRFNELDNLPAVPVEVAEIQENWQTVSLMEENFTLDAMQTVRQQSEFAIAHLATHAIFRDGSPSNSFVQLWGNERLTLDAIASLNFHSPPLELLVLSACQTAFGNTAAELGFAGLSVQSGAKSVVASLWQVSDTGTLALMSEFYNRLGDIPTKAEALRQAQLAILRNGAIVDAPIENIASLQASEVLFSPTLTIDLTHPYFWSGFTLIGSPW